MIDIFESDLRPMQVWHTKASDKLDRWATGKPEGFSTGFKTLDWYVRPVDGELTLVAARPSMGKTSLAMQMVESMAKQIQDEGEGCIAVFSAEMPGWSLYMRMASALCGVNVHKLRNGKGTNDEMHRMREAMNTLRSLPIWIDDNSGPTTEQMLEQLSRLHESTPVKGMMFDFVELGGDKGRNEEQRIGQIAQNLKAIAKTLGIPVLALSQLNRRVEERANKMPGLADLRYSGMLEQVADAVVFLMRPEYYVERGMQVDVPDEDKEGIAYVQVAKNRNGPIGSVRLAFVKDRAKFGDLTRFELNDY